MPVRSNRKIDFEILSGQWEIEQQFKNEQLEWYLHQLDMLNSGVPFADLELSKQREASLATVFKLHSGNYQSVISATHDLGSEQIPQGSFAHLKLNGVMRANDGLSSRGIQHMANNIAQAERNPNIEGGIIEANTGGGESIAGTILMNALKEAKKPWTVYYHTLASAGIKGTLPAKAIYASGKEARAGSIGTMMTVNKKMMQLFAENEEDIYADQAKWKNDEFRAYIRGDKGPITKVLTHSNEYFIEAVKEHRHINGTKEQRERVFGGAMLFAPEAQEVGLIDGIGTFSQAVDNLAGLADNAKHAPGNYFHNQNSDRMNFKSFFQQTLLPLINSKLGLNISEEAQPEEIQQQLTEAAGIQEARQEMRDEIAQEVRAQIEAAQKGQEEGKQEEGQGQEQEGNKDLAAIKEMMQSLSAKVDNLTERNKELEGEIADKTNKGKEHQQGKANGGKPNTQQFQTIATFQEAIQPEGGSKY